MSAPAAKIRSPPQTTTARTPSSAATCRAASESSSDTGRARAFAGGRSIRIVATAPSISTRTNSPIGPYPRRPRRAIAFDDRGAHAAGGRERPPGPQAPAGRARPLGAGHHRRSHAGAPLDRDARRRTDGVREGRHGRSDRVVDPRRAPGLLDAARTRVHAGLPRVLRRRDAAGPRARGPLPRPLAPAVGSRPRSGGAGLPGRRGLDAAARRPAERGRRPPGPPPGLAGDRRGPRAVPALGLCSDAWLEAALPTLLEAATTAPLEGSALLHFDVRSDNVCFRSGGAAVLVDWNWTSVGNPWLDVAGWLPSLHAEGGPRPEEVAPDVPAGARRRGGLVLLRPRRPAADPDGAARPRGAARAGADGPALGREGARAARAGVISRPPSGRLPGRPAQARCASSAASGSRRRRTTDTTNATTNSAEAVSTTAGPDAQFR